MPQYTVKIDHLQDEVVEAGSPREAARAVAALIRERPTLQALPDDEAVQIKTPERRAWGRNLSLGDFRSGDIAAEGSDEDGPVRDASIANYHGIAPTTES